MHWIVHALHCIVLIGSVLYCYRRTSVDHCIVLYCIALYCIVLLQENISRPGSPHHVCADENEYSNLFETKYTAEVRKTGGPRA